MKKYFAIKDTQAQELILVSDKEIDVMFKKKAWGIPKYYCDGCVFKVYPFPVGDVVFARGL